MNMTWIMPVLALALLCWAGYEARRVLTRQDKVPWPPIPITWYEFDKHWPHDQNCLVIMYTRRGELPMFHIGLAGSDEELKQWQASGYTHWAYLVAP